MNARRRGRRVATPSSGQPGRTASPISSLFGQEAMLPSSNASWLGLSRSANVWWRSSGTSLPSNQAASTTSASSYTCAVTEEYNKLLSDLYEQEMARMINDNSPLLGLIGE